MSTISSRAREGEQSAPAQPRFLIGRVRRFGRYENFTELSNLPSGHASAAFRSVGKINIDCQFLFKQTQWGVLGDDKCPAGILYLNLNFSPPQGCKLKSAAVTVTLDDEDPYLLNRPILSEAAPPGKRGEASVQITDWYGPKQLVGHETIANKMRVKQFIPEANVLGYGMGGVGAGSSTSFQQSMRWSFEGQLLPGKKTRLYKKLRWVIVENELEKQPSHSNLVHTAFTFLHSGKPFVMKVDVDGRLEKWDKHIMSKLRFGDMGNKARDSQAVTLVDFANSLKSERRLDEIARGLPLAMQMKNFEEVAPVFPRPVTNTTFHIASHPTSTANEDQATITAAPVAGSTQRPVPAVSQPLQDYSTFKEHLLPENPTQQKQPSWVHQDTDKEPTIQNLARIMRDLSDPEPIYGQPHHRAPPASVDDADTVVGSNDGREDTGTQTVPKQGVATQAMVLNDTDPQALVKILQILPSSACFAC